MYGPESHPHAGAAMATVHDEEGSCTSSALLANPSHRRNQLILKPPVIDSPGHVLVLGALEYVHGLDLWKTLLT
jgi:hypothetical protein